jgi:hypothetical protein
MARRCTSAQLVGRALQHQRQLAGLLAQPREHRQQAREALLLRQRRGQRRAFAHQHQRVERVGAHGAVASVSAAACSAFRMGTPAPASMASVPAKRARCSRGPAGRPAAA